MGTPNHLNLKHLNLSLDQRASKSFFALVMSFDKVHQDSHGIAMTSLVEPPSDRQSHTFAPTDSEHLSHAGFGGPEAEAPNPPIFQPPSMECVSDVNLTEDNFGNTETSLGGEVYSFDDCNKPAMQDIVFTSIGDTQCNPTVPNLDHWGSIIKIPLFPQIEEPIRPNFSMTAYPESWQVAPATFTDAVNGKDPKGSLINVFADQFLGPSRSAFNAEVSSNTRFTSFDTNEIIVLSESFDSPHESIQIQSKDQTQGRNGIPYNSNANHRNLIQRMGAMSQLVNVAQTMVDLPRRRVRSDRGKRRARPNNVHGRKGRLACAQCRGRRQQCVYAYEYLPCNFCRSRKIDEPCYKLYGPTTEKQLDVYRPVRTAGDGDISAEDVLLLHYAYTNLKDGAFGIFKVIFKKLPAVFGETLPYGPLQHAVVACAACELNLDEQMDSHMYRVYVDLIGKIHSSRRLTLADALSTILLAGIGVNVGEDEQSIIHANGCLSMLKAFLENSKGKPISEFEVCLTNIVIDMLSLFYNYFEVLDMFPVREIQTQGSEKWFKRRFKYLAFFADVPSERDNLLKCCCWDSIEFSTIYLLRLLLDVAKAESASELRKPSTQTLFQSVCLELDDTEFLEALLVLENRQDLIIASDWQCIKLCRSILGEPTLLEGLQSQFTIFVGTSIISNHTDADWKPYVLLISALTLIGDGLETLRFQLKRKIEDCYQEADVVLEDLRAFWSDPEANMDALLRIVRAAIDSYSSG